MTKWDGVMGLEAPLFSHIKRQVRESEEREIFPQILITLSWLLLFKGEINQVYK